MSPQREASGRTVRFFGQCADHGAWEIEASTDGEAIDIALRTSASNECGLTCVESEVTLTSTITSTVWLPPADPLSPVPTGEGTGA